jgi:transposase
MSLICVAADVSKGYADFVFRHEAGTRPVPARRYDDTPAGHAALRQTLAQLAAAAPDVRFRCGVEATGGLERNWLRFWAALPYPVEVYRLNPLAVRRFLDRDLHRNGNDRLAAQGIAAYLATGLRAADVPYEPDLEGPLTLYRFTDRLLDRLVQVENELQSLLPAVHPDLVQFTRQGLPAWLLRLLVVAPTVEALGRAQSATLARIPYLTAERAARLILAARRSVAALREPATATVVTALAEEALRLQEKIAQLKREVVRALKDDPVLPLLTTIPGIGPWTAACLRLEFGRFERFHSAAAVVAYAGLNPRIFQSGDGVLYVSISRRGKSTIRAALFMAALTAIQKNPPIAAFYGRLMARGKTYLQAMCACMSKLLRIAYACAKHGEAFDPARHLQTARREVPPTMAGVRAAPQAEGLAGSGALEAPVTRREAQRRRAAAAPQTGVSRPERGRGAAGDHDSTVAPSCQPTRELAGSAVTAGQNGRGGHTSRRQACRLLAYPPLPFWPLTLHEVSQGLRIRSPFPAQSTKDLEIGSNCHRLLTESNSSHSSSHGIKSGVRRANDSSLPASSRAGMTA